MSRPRGARPKPSESTSARGPKKARRRALEALIEEATVDCYNEDEAFWGIYTCVEEHMRFPFAAKALGDPVEIVGVDASASGPRRGLRVRVRKGRKIYSVAVTVLVLQESLKGREWLDAYRLWEAGR